MSCAPARKMRSNSAFAAAGQLGAEALVIGPYNFFNTRNHQLAMAALRHRMPAIFNDRAFAAAGGLVSYGGTSWTNIV